MSYDDLRARYAQAYAEHTALEVEYAAMQKALSETLDKLQTASNVLRIAREALLADAQIVR